MQTGYDGLYRVKPKQCAKAVQTLADAFGDYPLFCGLLPDRQKRMAALKILFTILIRYAVKKGDVYALSPNLTEVLIWRPVYNQRVNVRSFLWSLPETVSLVFCLGAKRISRLKAVFDQVDKEIAALNLPADTAYLDTLGVQKAYQGQKRAKKLLQPVLAGPEKDGRPVFLVTNREVNVRIYERFGFHVEKKSRIKRIDVPVWYMVKP